MLTSYFVKNKLKCFPLSELFCTLLFVVFKRVVTCKIGRPQSFKVPYPKSPFLFDSAKQQMRTFSRKSATVLNVCVIRHHKELINTGRGKIHCFLLLKYVVVSGLSTDVKMNRLASSQKCTVGP